MEKDFQAWHRKKMEIDSTLSRPFFSEGEVWLCRLGVNIGFEQNGVDEDFLRPVVILRKFSKEVFWAIPLTRSSKDNNKASEKYYYRFSFMSGVNSTAILSQVRLVDAKRLNSIMGMTRKEDFVKIKEKLKALLP